MTHLLFGLVSLIWGTSFILMKKASLAFGPLSIAALRVAFGALALVVVIKLVKANWNLKKSHIFSIPLIAITGNIYPYVIIPHLIALYGSAFIGMMVGFVPIMTILISIPMLKARPSRSQLRGVLGGLLCLAMICSDGFSRGIPFSALLLASTAPLTFSFTNTYIKRNMTDISPLSLTCAMLIFSSTITLPVAFALEPVEINNSLLPAFLSIIVLGVFCTGIATHMFLLMVQKRGPLFAGMVTYVIPVIAIIWGWLDSEYISPMQLAAIAGIIVSVAIAQSK
jgi:drug/metabolite transporter (DMT)-like permease